MKPFDLELKLTMKRTRIRAVLDDVPGHWDALGLRTGRLTYLPDDMLVKVDRAAMAVSRETRFPCWITGLSSSPGACR